MTSASQYGITIISKKQNERSYIMGGWDNMKKISVIIIHSNKKAEVIKCLNISDATEYMKQRYVDEIRRAPFYDYEHSFISRSFKYAQVSAGVFGVKMWVCCNSRYYKRKAGKWNGKRKRYKRSKNKSSFD